MSSLNPVEEMELEVGGEQKEKKPTRSYEEIVESLKQQEEQDRIDYQTRLVREATEERYDQLLSHWPAAKRPRNDGPEGTTLLYEVIWALEEFRLKEDLNFVPTLYTLAEFRPNTAKKLCEILAQHTGTITKLNFFAAIDKDLFLRLELLQDSRSAINSARAFAALGIAIGKCPELEYLSFMSQKIGTLKANEITALFTPLKNCTKLKTLLLPSCQLDQLERDSAVALGTGIAAIPQLETLDLRDYSPELSLRGAIRTMAKGSPNRHGSCAAFIATFPTYPALTRLEWRSANFASLDDVQTEMETDEETAENPTPPLWPLICNSLRLCPRLEHINHGLKSNSAKGLELDAIAQAHIKVPTLLFLAKEAVKSYASKSSASSSPKSTVQVEAAIPAAAASSSQGL